MPTGIYKRTKPAWNKNIGKNLTKHGYKRLTTPDGRRLLEHRFIIEKYLGRRLKTSEVVHHINHNKIDNRIENLELFSNHSQHMKKYPEIKCQRRWDLIKIPKIKFNRWNKKPKMIHCLLKQCKRLPKIGFLCKPCYISWWKWKNHKIRNHFSSKAII